eukprot:Hpha_TRINITY_DN16326_c2_g4::TRINITY_DN16326_c2_g4_i1::g.60225::m.60225
MGGDQGPGPSDIEDVERMCSDELRTIDQLERELRKYTKDLAELAEREEDAQRDSERRVNEAERQTADLNWLVSTLRSEAERLSEELKQREDESGKLEGQRAVQQAEERAAVAAVGQGLTSDATDIVFAGDDLARALRSREIRLRELEDRELSAEDVRRQNKEDQVRLAEEHRQLTEEGAAIFEKLEKEIQETQSEAEGLNAEVKGLCTQRREFESRNRQLRSEQEALRMRESDLKHEERALQEDLRQVQVAHQNAVADIAVYTLPFAVQGSDIQLQKLDEAMMLLKAHASFLGDDFEFYKEVFHMYDSVPADAFSVAFDFVREYVWSAYGDQVAGDRWCLVGRMVEVHYDEVEHLLSALKQMVASFDQLDSASKRQLPCATEVIRNSSHLVHLAQQCTEKFRERIEECEQQKAREEAAKAERIRRSLERSRVRSRNVAQRFEYGLPIDGTPQRAYRRESSTPVTQQPPQSAPKLAPLESRHEEALPEPPDPTTSPYIEG